MGKPCDALIPVATRSSVRSEVLAALAQHSREGAKVPIPLGPLFLKVCARLERVGIVPPRAERASYTSLRYSPASVSFPDFGAPEDIARFVREVLWDLYSQGVLAPASGRECPPDVDRGSPFSFLDLDCAVLTDYGQDTLADTTNRIQVHDPDGYPANFWSADPPPDGEMMRYLEECVAVFRGGHFLATIVLLGVASERPIEVLAQSLREALGEPTGEEWFNGTYVNKRDFSKRFSALSGKLMGEYSEDLDRAKLKDAFNGVVTLTVEQIRCARNDIAHPKGRKFTWNEVGGLLHSFAQYFTYANQVIKLLTSNPKSV